MNENMKTDSKRKQNIRRQQRRIFLWKLVVIMMLLNVVCVATIILFTGTRTKKEVTSNHIQSVQEIESQAIDESTMNSMDWNLVLVNNENAIPDNYEPKLVEVPGGEKVDERIYEPLMEMLEDAKKANWDQLPMVVSGYRTQEKQKKIMDDKIAEFRREGNSKSEAEELAKKWVAKPGYSEHQTGLAVDINGATYDLYFWLQENCYKYGFIFRYPGDKTDITGVAEEVWHYRYVGVEAATEIHERGICLEEYLEEKRMKQ